MFRCDPRASLILAALSASLLLASAGAAGATTGGPPRLLIVVDGPMHGAEARALGGALLKGLSNLVKPWRVAVVGTPGKLLEASPLFYAKDLRAIRNAALALSHGDTRLGRRLEHALRERTAKLPPRDLRLFLLTLRPLDASALAPLEKMAKKRGLELTALALSPQAEASPPAGAPAAKNVVTPDVLAEKLAAAVQKMVPEQAKAAKAAKLRAAAGAKTKWTWRHWLYVGGGALALLVLFGMIWGVFSRGRVRRLMRRRAEALAAERKQIEEMVKSGHATIVDAVAELLAFVGEVYAIFPCKRCEETLFKLQDVTSNGRSIQLKCDACSLSVWAKCCITEPPPDLDQNFDHLRDTIDANRKAAKKVGIKHSYPPLLVQANAQFEEDAAGQKIERVVVRERMTMRPKILIQCAYCQKTVYYDGQCPECGARREAGGGA